VSIAGNAPAPSAVPPQPTVAVPPVPPLQAASVAANADAGIGGSVEQSARLRTQAPRIGATRALRPDMATIVGLGGAFVLIAAAIALGGAWSAFVDLRAVLIVLGGAWSAFVDLRAVLIVLGGTAAVTAISFGAGDLGRARRAFGQCLRRAGADPEEAALSVLNLAEKARVAGLLQLQDQLPKLRRQPFLQRGLHMVVDGTPEEEADRILRRELAATDARQRQGAGVLRRAAEVAPAMGLIGTLVGLVQMLANLNDPSAIGPGMAVALLTTFYGAVLANMVLAPLAAKLEKRAGEESLVNEIYLMGVASIARRENPRRLEMLINTVLPPARRVSYFT